MYLLGPHPTTERDHNNVLVIMDRYSQLDRVLAIDKVQTLKSVESFLDSFCTMFYGLPNYVLTDTNP